MSSIRPCDIMLISGFTDNISQFGTLSCANKMAFCTLNGYQIKIFKDKDFDKRRLPAWSKLKFIRSTILNHKSDVKWVFWSDADAIITNFSTNLCDFVQTDADIVITKDHNNFNTGNFFMRVCDWSAELLVKAWKMTKYLDHPWFEQRAIIELFENKDILSHVKVVPQRDFNSYPGNIAKNKQGDYQPGDFILHFPGRNKESMRQRMIDELKNVNLYEVSLQMEHCV